MNNNEFKNIIAKNDDWFKKMKFKKIEELHADNKKIGSILNHLNYNSFINKYKTFIGTKYILLNISNLSFCSFYGESFKNSIYFKITKEIDDNFENKDYTYKDSILYKELKENKITTLSEYFNLCEPNNLEKYSKFYDFFPWNKDLKICCDKFCGPYHDSIINMHFIKLKRVLEGIKKYGMKYNEKNMIKGSILKKNNDKKIVVNSGIHRTIVVKYLYEVNKLDNINIICQKTDEIDIYDLNKWYQVENGFISKENAKKIFDHLFNI